MSASRNVCRDMPTPRPSTYAVSASPETDQQLRHEPGARLDQISLAGWAHRGLTPVASTRVVYEPGLMCWGRRVVAG